MTQDIKMRCYSYMANRSINFTILFKVSTYSTLILHIYQRLTAGGNLTPTASETLSSDVMHRRKGGKSDYNEEIRLS